MKIERNSFCPCHSGLKYKKCCLINPERGEIASQMNAEYIDRDYVFADLKSRSDTLARFFDAIPVSLIQSIWIFINPQLTSNMRSASGFGHRFIIIRNFPIDDCDFFDFAHEICHFIFSAKGYPQSTVESDDPDLTILGTILTNAIMDPLVNSLVVRYGFDLNEYIAKTLRIQLPLIMSFPHKTIEEQHFLRCLCIEKILEWKVLSIPSRNDFLPAFQLYHPHEYKFACEFVDSLDLSRLCNAQYVRDKLTQLIKDNRMDRIVRLA